MLICPKWQAVCRGVYPACQRKKACKYIIYINIEGRMKAGTDLGLPVDVTAILDQNLSHGHFVLLGSQMHGGQSVLGLHVRISLVFQEQGHHVGVSFLGGQMQWGEAIAGLSIGLGAVLQQCGSDVHLVLLGSNVQWSVAVLGCGVRAGFVLQQQKSHAWVVVVGGHVEWGQTVFALHVGVSLLGQQDLGHFDVAIFGCDVKRCEALLQFQIQAMSLCIICMRQVISWSSHTYLGGEVLGSTMVQQNRGDLLMTFLGSDVQGRVEVLGGGVWRGAMLQEQHHIVYVAHASGNVQWSLVLLGKD